MNKMVKTNVILTITLVYGKYDFLLINVSSIYN